MKKLLLKRLLYVLFAMAVGAYYLHNKQEKSKPYRTTLAATIDMKKLIVGLWQHESDKLTFADGSSRTHPQENERVFTLYGPDGTTVSYVSGEEEDAYDPEHLISEGTYSLSNDGRRMTVKKESVTETFSIKLTIADRLVLTQEDGDGGSLESTFKRIKLTDS